MRMIRITTWDTDDDGSMREQLSIQRVLLDENDKQEWSWAVQIMRDQIMRALGIEGV